MPAGRIPGPQDSSQSHNHDQHHAVPPGRAAATPGHLQALSVPGADRRQPSISFQYPPGDGLYVRYFYTSGGQPVAEVWRQKRRVDPPPGRVKQADATKRDCLLRVGDTILYGKIDERNLRDLGFTDGGSNIFTALLFWLLDIGESNEYRAYLVLKDIRPKLTDQYRGGVLFYRYITAGSIVLPCPEQLEIYEDLSSFLSMREIAEELAFLKAVLEWEVDFIINILWALTGGVEVKACEEVCEKYVVKSLLKIALKYLKPKFLAVVRAYMEGFIKEMAAQAFRRVLLMARQSASDRLMKSVGKASNTITVDEIHLLESSSKLTRSLDKTSIGWRQCHLKGMEAALKPLWKIIPVKAYANESFKRCLDTCLGYIDKFFFDLKIRAVVEKGQDKLSEKIYELVAETITDWVASAAGLNHEVTSEVAERQVHELALKKLVDGSIIDLAYKYLQDNWESLAKQALQAATDAITKEITNASPRSPLISKASGAGQLLKGSASGE